MKGIFVTVIKFAISLLLLWFLVNTSKLDFNLLPALFHFPFLLFICFSLYIIVVGISTWRWHQLNTVQDMPLSYSYTLLPTYLGIAFNNLLPGGVGGDFFRFYFISKKITIKKSVIMLSILFDRLTGLTGVFLAVCLVALLNRNFFTQQTYTSFFVLTSFLLSLSILLTYLASSFLPKEIGVSAWLHNRFAGRWIRPILSVFSAMRIYRNAEGVMGGCLISSVIIQFFIAVTCMLIAQMMQLPPIPFSHYIMAIAITQIVNLIPIAPGGFGMGEMAFANMITLLNPGIEGTFATVFLAYRLLGILVYLPGIMVFLFDKNLLQEHTFFKEQND